MPLSQLLLEGLAESGDIGGWQERQAKHQMSLLDLQEKQRAIADAQKLRDLYASGQDVTYEKAAAIDPLYAQKMQQFNNEQLLKQYQMLESQGKIQENRRKDLEAKQHTFANTLGVGVENWLDSLGGRQPTQQDIEAFKPQLGGMIKFIDETYGYKPDVPIDPYHPEQILSTAERLGYASRRSKAMGVQQEEAAKLPYDIQRKQAPNFGERFGTVTRNPTTGAPELLPPVRTGNAIPQEDLSGMSIADPAGNLVELTVENLPKIKEIYQQIENPSIKNKVGVFINQLQQQGSQLPIARGTTAAEKGEIAGAEAKARKIGEAEASREIQHEKMTAAFDYQHLKDLINKSTPGGVAEYGTMATQAATLSTPWSKADTQLGIDAAALLQSVPRFEGPQSDADRASYEKAAGNLAKPNIPRGDRIAALDEMKSLLDKYDIKYGKEANLDEAVKGRRKAALDMLNKGEIDEAQFKTLWDQK